MDLFLCDHDAKTLCTIMSKEKRKENMDSDIKSLKATIILRGAQFKRNYMQGKRLVKQTLSSCISKYRKITPSSPSKLPIPTNPVKSMPSHKRSFIVEDTPKLKPGTKTQKKLFDAVSVALDILKNVLLYYLCTLLTINTFAV